MEFSIVKSECVGIFREDVTWCEEACLLSYFPFCIMMQKPVLVTYMSSDREKEEEEERGNSVTDERQDEVRSLRKKQEALEATLNTLIDQIKTTSSAPTPASTLPTPDPSDFSRIGRSATFVPHLEHVSPIRTPGSTYRSNISMRGSRLWKLNRSYRTAYDEMNQRILEVGRLGCFSSGRHQRDVDVTITVKSTSTEDSVTYEMADLEPDHVTNLLRLEVEDKFKRMVDDAIMTDRFTEEEVRTGVESHRDGGDAVAKEEFLKRNNGWQPKDYYGVYRTYKEMSKCGKKRRRTKGAKFRKRVIAIADCCISQDQRNVYLQEMVKDLQAELAEKNEEVGPSSS